MLEGLNKLFDMMVVPSKDWFEGKEPAVDVRPEVEAITCTSYNDLLDAWDHTYRTGNRTKHDNVSLRFNDDIDIGFSIMLAVVASTQQQGTQLWVRPIGSPGSAKSTLCGAIEANKKYVFGMSKFTGFHSGMGGQSLFHKIKNMTVVVNEGDMLLTAPNKDQILSEIRDFFTGRVTAIYKNGVMYEESGLRITFIVAGTSTIRRLNRSSAGDRFVDIIIHERKVKGKEDIGERELLKTVAKLAANRTRNVSLEDASTHELKEKTIAIQKTVGFVNYLRENAATELPKIEVTEDTENKCINLAQLVAYMRARPDLKAEGEETEAEMATRLTEQFIRMAMCLAFVMRKTKIDAEVMRRVAKSAKDTCKGPSMTLCEKLLEKPMDVRGLEARTEFKVDTVRIYKNILLSLGCISGDNARSNQLGKLGKGVYRLTPQMTGLLKNLYKLLGAELPKQ